jgi:hypothetical protein
MPTLFDLFKKYTSEKYPEFQFFQFKDEKVFVGMIEEKLREKGILAARDQFNDMEMEEILSKCGEVYDTKMTVEPDPDVLDPNFKVIINKKMMSKFSFCHHCEKFILEGKVQKCSGCQTTYHYNGQCNPVPYCYPCRNAIPANKELDYIWPLELFKERRRPFLTRPKKLPDIVDRSLFDAARDQILTKGNHFIHSGKYTTRNHLKRDFIFFPSFNKELIRLAKKDEELIEQFREEVFLSPIMIAQVPGMGLGVIASRDIEALEFICFYAGDVINQAYANRHGLSEYNFQLSEGPEMTKTFSIIPTEYWSFGPILNHADGGKSNCRSLRFIGENGVEIIIFAEKPIRKGEQLLYDYNLGGGGHYETNGFKK